MMRSARDRGIDRYAVLLQGVTGAGVGGDDEHLASALERVSEAVWIGEIAAPDANAPLRKRRSLVELAHADADLLRRQMVQKMFDYSAAERPVGTADDDHAASLDRLNAPSPD